MELKVEVLGSVLGTLGTVYAVLRWLLWPRAELMIRVEVEKALKPYKDRMTEELGHLARELGRIADVLHVVEASQTQMAISQAATQTSVDFLREDRRSGHDRRRGEE
jgi:cysteine synthase